MSQRDVEATLGRLICDDAFRREFYDDAVEASARAGFLLTPVELESLYRITPQTFEAIVQHVDNRLRRADLLIESVGTERRTSNLKPRTRRSRSAS